MFQAHVDVGTENNFSEMSFVGFLKKNPQVSSCVTLFESEQYRLEVSFADLTDLHTFLSVLGEVVPGICSLRIVIFGRRVY